MKRRRVIILLFGEGKADAIFLRHLANIMIDRNKGVTFRIGHGQGGSPEQVIERMIKKELFSAEYDRTLLLLDSDRPVTEAGLAILSKRSITLVRSTPCCLEGMLLTILDDPPPNRERQLAKNWKSKFHRDYLKTDREGDALSRLPGVCSELFSADFLRSKCPVCPPLDELVKFLTT